MDDSGNIGIQRHAFHVFIHCCISGRHELFPVIQPVGLEGGEPKEVIHTYPRPYPVVIRDFCQIAP